MKSGAAIEGNYRYRLWRSWGPGSHALWVMLNPSTANATKDDATIRKCVGFTRRWGYDGIQVMNLFAWRARDPRALLQTLDPIGVANDEQLYRESHAAALTVVGWGSQPILRTPAMRRRIVEVRNLLENPQCLGRNADHSPRHPLMLAYNTPLEEYR